MELIAPVFHFIADFFNAFVKPLAPYFIDKFNIDNRTFASSIALIGGLTSLFQVLFGAYFDKKSRDGLYITSIVLLEIFFITFLGFVNSFIIFIALVVIVRILNSAFHPVTAGFAGKSQKGKHIAMFSVAGTLGAGVAPIFITAYQKLVGIEKLYYITIIVALLILLSSKNLISYRKEVIPTKKLSLKVDILKLFPIFLIVMTRSFSMNIFHTYIPIYMNEAGNSLVIGGSVLTAGMILGVFTNYLGTVVLEKTNSKITNSIGFLGMGIFGLLFVFIPGLTFKIISFILFDGFSFFTMSSNIVTAQKLLPNNKALASSISMGFSWAIGSFLTSGYSAIFGNNIMFMLLSASIAVIITLVIYIFTVKV
ncbi:MAG: MFS transporter [Thermosipho sp. (in: Bacteria)]|nr:MFS transporter [Thermosipho sp. (in: thermotogales)]